MKKRLIALLLVASMALEVVGLFAYILLNKRID